MATNLIARTRQRLNSLREWQPNVLPRPAQMLLTVAATLAAGLLADWLAGSPVWHRLFYPAQNIPADVQAWSALIYALLLIGGLPVAFLIWHWRDVNVRDQIENARKDINLKEFQEVQLRAAGALDEKLPLEAREQLQIAALHQLRGFLRGDYGDSFKRPAFELLLAGHAAAVFRIGVPEVQAQVRGNPTEEIHEAAAALRVKLSPIDRARMRIIRDEAEHILNGAFPVDGRRFDFLDLSRKKLPRQLNLRYSHFFDADLTGAHLQGANLEWAHLERADLINTLLESASLAGAYLHFANLSGSNIQDARLNSTKLNGANLGGADIDGAIFFHTYLENANLFGREASRPKTVENATFNNATEFMREISPRWSDLTEAEREEARAPWIARGMVRSDLPPPVEEEQPAAPAPD